MLPPDTGSSFFEEAVAYSCDLVFYKLGRELGIDKLIHYAKMMGLGKNTGIDLPGEFAGLLPDKNWRTKIYRESWYDGDTVNLSIGQGFLEVTPLQLAMLTASLANGGKVLQPRLLDRVVDSRGETVKSNPPRIINRLKFQAQDMEMLKIALRKAVTDGTGVAADSQLGAIAGKTGTAENKACRENPEGLNHAWFTCFVPFENPQIAITVMFEKSGGFGGEYAAPVARKIAEKYLEITGQIKLKDLEELSKGEE